MYESQKYKPLSQKSLRKQFIHSFIATIADNSIEIGWVLIMAWHPVQTIADRNITMFALNDAVWTNLSTVYYALRTSMSALLPEFMIGKQPDAASRILKNTLYIIYIILTPIIFLAILFEPQMLHFMGVKPQLFPYYLPYFRLSFLVILIACPTGLIIPSYFRAIFQTKIAMFLDNLTAVVMLIGAFTAVHIFHLGAIEMLWVCFAANLIPLIYFLIKRPIPHFFAKGFEFDPKIIKKSLSIANFEAIRRLAPRLSFLFASSSLFKISGLVLEAHYFFDLIKTFLEGIIESNAGLAIINLSHNKGLKLRGYKAYLGLNYILQLSLRSNFIGTTLIFAISPLWIQFTTPNLEVRQLLQDPIVWILMCILANFNLYYFNRLAITRTYRRDLNKIAQLIRALPSLFLTSFAIALFVNILNWGLRGYYLALVVANGLSAVLMWIYLKWHKVEVI